MPEGVAGYVEGMQGKEKREGELQQSRRKYTISGRMPDWGKRNTQDTLAFPPGKTSVAPFPVISATDSIKRCHLFYAKAAVNPFLVRILMLLTGFRCLLELLFSGF